MQLEIEKLRWWVKGTQMEQHRWPRLAMEEMMQDYRKYSWAKEVRKTMEKYDIDRSVLREEEPVDAVKDIVMKKTWKVWAEAIDDKVELGHYPVKEGGREAAYMDGTIGALTFCKGRINDVWGIAGVAQVDRCPGCMERVEYIWDHIIKECHTVSVERRREKKKVRGWWEGRIEMWGCAGMREEAPEANKAMGMVMWAWMKKWKV